MIRLKSRLGLEEENQEIVKDHAIVKQKRKRMKKTSGAPWKYGTSLRATG